MNQRTSQSVVPRYYQILTGQVVLLTGAKPLSEENYPELAGFDNPISQTSTGSQYKLARSRPTEWPMQIPYNVWVIEEVISKET